MINMTNFSLQQKYLQTANGKICYFLNKEFESRPTVVFLHGLSSNHTTWLANAEVLNKLKFNCLLPDLRGHGHSDKTKKRSLYKIPVFTDDLKKIIETENLSKIILVGYSYGGFIAMDYAIKYPESTNALILISANHVNPFKYKKIDFLTMPAYWFLSFLAWLLLWQKKKSYYYDQATAKGYWQSTFSGFTTMPLSVNLWMLSEIANIDFSKDIRKINCPTLMIRSQADPFLSSTEITNMAREIKSSKIAVLNEPSHFLASRHQEKILELIINFLREEKIL